MSEVTEKPTEVTEIPLEKCIGGLFDLRSSWENGELRKSIEEDGVLTPITVRASKVHPGKYEVIDGNRRVRIATGLGLKKIPAMIYPELDDNAALKMAIVTNVARATLTARDQGVAVQRYRKINPDKPLDIIAVELGMSPKLVRDYCYMAELDPSIKIAAPGTPVKVIRQKGEISPRTARQLARATAKKHADLDERQAIQKELVKKMSYMPEHKRSKVIQTYGRSPMETTVDEAIKEVVATTKHTLSVEVTDEMFNALGHFQKDRNLDVSKALRQLIFEGLRRYKYMV